MKTTLITLLLKVGIWVMEYALNKISKSSNSLKEDFVINKDTAKAFTKFIKSHTVKEQVEDKLVEEKKEA